MGVGGRGCCILYMVCGVSVYFLCDVCIYVWSVDEHSRS